MISRDRFELALERLKAGDWEIFEKFATDFLAADYPNLESMASPSGDDGRDAELRVPKGDSTVALQFSVSTGWEQKILRTADRIKERLPGIQVLVYATNQRIGALADKVRKRLRQEKELHLEVFDREAFAQRRDSSPTREALAESLARKMVDPLLPEMVKRKGSPLSSAEAKAALVYLGLQFEDDSREKGLTKVCFEALVRAVLRDATPEAPLGRGEVNRRVREILSSHAAEKVDALTDSALSRLTKRRIRHITKTDEFCLTFEERQKQADRISSLERGDTALREEIAAALGRVIPEMSIREEELRDLCSRARRVLETFLLSRGEAFVAAVSEGDFHQLGTDELSGLVLKDIGSFGYAGSLRGSINDVLRDTVAEILLNPGEAVGGYLRGLADAYTLLAFLTETPDVQSAVGKMFAHGEIWLDTSVILPVFLEDLAPPDRRAFTGMLLDAREAGCDLRATEGVIEEIESHMHASLVCCRKPTSAWLGKVPFLFSGYVMSGQPTAEFAKWISRFRGDKRPADDIREWLNDRCGIEMGSLKDDAAVVSTDLRMKVEAILMEAREKRDPAHQDPMVTRRLVEHDVENYVGVIGRRKGELPSPFGYKAWWLTLDRTSLEVRRKLKERISGKLPHSPVMSPDFLVNYLAFGPVRGRVSRRSDSALPLLLDARANDNLPLELLSLAEKIRAESKDMPALAVNRQVRDGLDAARRRLGSISRGGFKEVAARTIGVVAAKPVSAKGTD